MKTGDLIRIKDGLIEGRIYGGIVYHNAMKSTIGVTKLPELSMKDGEYFYRINGWCISKEMLEKVNLFLGKDGLKIDAKDDSKGENMEQKFKIGDEVNVLTDDKKGKIIFSMKSRNKNWYLVLTNDSLIETCEENLKKDNTNSIIKEKEITKKVITFNEDFVTAGDIFEMKNLITGKISNVLVIKVKDEKIKMCFLKDAQTVFEINIGDIGYFEFTKLNLTRHATQEMVDEFIQTKAKANYEMYRI